MREIGSNITRKLMFKKYGVVKIEKDIKLLDQNDFRVNWKMFI